MARKCHNQSILAKALRSEIALQHRPDEPASILDRIRTTREASAGPKRTTKRPRKPKAAQ